MEIMYIFIIIKVHTIILHQNCSSLITKIIKKEERKVDHDILYINIYI